MGNGKIDARMRCESGEAAQVMEMAGTDSPEAYSITVSLTDERGAEPGGEMRMSIAWTPSASGNAHAKKA